MIQELFKSLVDSLLGRGVSRSDRTAGEIRDLNRKIHDALVGVEDAMKSERGLGGKIVNRLRLNAPRIKKYDETIHDDINTLLSLFNDGKPLLVDREKDAMELIEQIRYRVDKLVLKKG